MTSPYEVKRKEYRLDKADSTLVEVQFSIKGPTICSKKFQDEATAKKECDIMNEVYNKGYQDALNSQSASNG